MQHQAEFDATPPQPHCQPQIEHLVAYLFGRGEVWTTAKQISADLGFDDRHIRHYAELSDNRIVSGPGCPGYRHARHTSVDLVNEVINRLQSQGKRMIQRSIRIGKYVHSIIR